MTGEQAAVSSVQEFIADPAVPDSVDVAAGCQDLEEDEDFSEKQMRRLNRGEIESAQ